MGIRSFIRLWVLGSFVSLVLCTSLNAQITATIVGTVTDPSGAVIPGATITLTNTQTAISRTFTSNSAGAYTASPLPIGEYTLRVEVKAFKTYERTGIVLNVNDTLRIDVQLQVGEITQSMTISESAVNVQTQTAEVSDVIQGKQVMQLAINGRNFMALAALTTGASSMLPSFNLPIPVGSNRNISFNGNRIDHNIFLIDGGEDYDRGCGGCPTIMPSMDAIAEFRVQTSNSGPDFGMGSAATVNMALKSGTENFHGEAYDFLRNDALDANNFFANRSGTAKPPLKFNNFGYNIGGPFYIPGKSPKGKTFFFWNEEWRRLRQGTQIFAPAFTAAERRGDFSNDLTGQIDTKTGFDKGAVIVPKPLPGQTLPAGLVVGQPFPGNKIPSSMVDSNALLLASPSILPLPNTPDGKFFSAAPSVPINVREEIIRVDHNISDKLQIMAHYINEAVQQQLPTSLWSNDTYPTVGTQFINPSKHAVVRLTWTLSPSTLNEFAVKYNGNRIDLTPTGTFALPSGVTGVGDIFPGNRLNRIPTLRFSGGSGVTFDVGRWPWANSYDNYQFADDVTKTVGQHTLKFGGALVRQRKKQDLFGHTQGFFTFNGKTSSNDFADFLLGRAFQYDELALQDRGHWRTWTFAFYLNDNWRVNRRLTMQLGLRYEGIPHTYERFDRQSNFYPSLFDPAKAQSPSPDGTLDPNGPGFEPIRTNLANVIPGIRLYTNGTGVAGKNEIPRGLVDNHWDTFGPRIGFAYDLGGNGKTVLRGGYGEFYERIQGNDVYNAAANVPFSLNATVFDVPLTGTGGAVAGGGIPIFPASLTTLSKEYLIPVTHQFSFGVQRELFPQGVLTVEYVGTAGAHQRIQRDVNQPLMDNPLRGKVNANFARPFPGFAGINQGENSTNTNYHSLQVNFRVNNYHGITFQSAYTWSRSIDFGSGDFATVVNAYDIRAERGISNWDRRHMLTLNYVYGLPFGKNTTGPLKQVIGGWQLSGITSFASGLPFTVTAPGDPAGIGRSGVVRPNLVGECNGAPRTAEAFFNTAAFSAVAPVGSAPGATGFGNSSRNTCAGARRNQWDIALFKNFTGVPFPGNKEGATVQFRTEFFNAFNHTQFNDYFSGFAQKGFGQARGAFEPRIIEFALKFIF